MVAVQVRQQQCGDGVCARTRRRHPLLHAAPAVDQKRLSACSDERRRPRAVRIGNRTSCAEQGDLDHETHLTPITGPVRAISAEIPYRDTCGRGSGGCGRDVVVGGGKATSGRSLRSSPRAGCARSVSRCRCDGVDEDVAALNSALRANGIAVSCLGGDPTWAVEHDAALNWAFRATADAVFDGVHLDVEPWTLPAWPDDAAALMASYSTLVEEMTEVAPLAVDLCALAGR